MQSRPLRSFRHFTALISAFLILSGFSTFFQRSDPPISASNSQGWSREMSHTDHATGGWSQTPPHSHHQEKDPNCDLKSESSGASNAISQVRYAIDDAVPKWERQKQGSKWTRLTHEILETHGQSLLDSTPRDIDEFCPNYRAFGPEERKVFWTHFISMMVKHESTYDPQATHTEAIRDKNGNPVISRGLMQVSKDSCAGYGYKVKEATDLHDPRHNLTCAIMVMNTKMATDQVITESERILVQRKGKKPKWVTVWHGLSAYFGSLRNDTKARLVPYSEIRDSNRDLMMCRL